jgi:hypothetical protein
MDPRSNAHLQIRPFVSPAAIQMAWHGISPLAGQGAEDPDEDLLLQIVAVASARGVVARQGSVEIGSDPDLPLGRAADALARIVVSGDLAPVLSWASLR